MLVGSINLSVPEGLNHIVVYCNDLFSNTWNSSVYFTVDISPPDITFLGPSEKQASTSVTLMLITDEDCYCRWSESYRGYQEMANKFSGGQGRSVHSASVTASEGMNTFYVSCSDLAGNTLETQSMEFRVDADDEAEADKDEDDDSCLGEGEGDCNLDSDCCGSLICDRRQGTDYCCPEGERWDGEECSIYVNSTTTTSTTTTVYIRTAEGIACKTDLDCYEDTRVICSGDSKDRYLHCVDGECICTSNFEGWTTEGDKSEQDREPEEVVDGDDTIGEMAGTGALTATTLLKSLNMNRKEDESKVPVGKVTSSDSEDNVVAGIINIIIMIAVISVVLWYLGLFDRIPVKEISRKLDLKRILKLKKRDENKGLGESLYKRSIRI
ncbi:MAG: hypothetical protein U9Q22_08040 [Candidatus Altiarchaeota archaeon]|nr:hypothetical protein [Candidatus Altiarchaeota archaeon]